MNEKPILFSGPMVEAILDGRKTQTRRVVTPSVKGCTVGAYTGGGEPVQPVNIQEDGGPWTDIKSPYGSIGDRLWVRETFSPDCETVEKCRASFEDLMPGCSGPYYRATASEFDIDTLRWKPSIHMPRWASRINLEITGIRVERLRDISQNDCYSEGVVCSNENHQKKYIGCGGIKGEFAKLWDSINEKRGFGWDKNPWVWALNFKKLKNDCS